MRSESRRALDEEGPSPRHCTQLLRCFLHAKGTEMARVVNEAFAQDLFFTGVADRI